VTSTIIHLGLRVGVSFLMLFSILLITTDGQLQRAPSPSPPNVSEFSPQPIPRFPRESVFPIEPPILNPEVKARYYVNVADYGAKTGLTFDNTLAIQAAINAACNPDFSNEYYSARPVLFFPPGLWQIYQPQLPSTNSPLSIPCTIEIEGSGFTAGPQFSELAPGSWLFVHAGPQPNAAAAITYSYPLHAIIRSINISGFNQAVAVYSVAPSLFEDVCLQALATGMPDNTPLKVTDSFWFWFRGGCLQTNSTDVPVAMFTAETLPAIPNAGLVSGLLFFSDLITAGGGFKYIQRAPSNGPVPGNFVFRNITLEEGTDLLEISEECTGCGNWWMSSLTFDNVAAADSSCTTCSVLNMNAPGLILSGVLIHHSFAGNEYEGRAITVNSGLLAEHYVDGCSWACSSSVLDGSGNQVWNNTGKVALSGGTKTLEFYPVFFHDFAPTCTPNDETSINGAKITTTLTSMTITGGSSDVVDYACFTNNPLGLP
jgi:hypothetical protein